MARSAELFAPQQHIVKTACHIIGLPDTGWTLVQEALTVSGNYGVWVFERKSITDRSSVILTCVSGEYGWEYAWSTQGGDQ